MTRKVAVNKVIRGDVTIKNCIVEINNGHVTDYYHFEDEQPFTEWLGGTIEILSADNGKTLIAMRDGKVLE